MDMSLSKPLELVMDTDNHNTVVAHLEPDILECEAKWALGSITISKASGGDRIPAHDIFHRIRTSNPKIYIQPPQTQNCESNLEEKEQSWRHNPPRLHTVLQSYSNQNRTVLAQKQTGISGTDERAWK